MKHQMTVFCKVGRAEPQALSTFPDSKTCDAECTAVESAKFVELIKSGVAPERISFSRVTTDSPNGKGTNK